jgi:DNA invertase Pin-like site-specific DNA recombinase
MREKKAAVAYLRVSGLGQVDGDGLPRQSAAVTAYAKHAGLTIVETYQDKGVSGTKDLEDRPGLAALLDRIESNGVRVVLVESASRLARDYIVSETILGQFRKHAVKVFDAEGIELTAPDDSDPTRRLIRQVLASVAEFDRRVTVLKLRAARERVRRRDGHCEGRKGFGATPAEEAVLKRILALRRHGSPMRNGRMSFQKIAAMLNAEGVPSRTGKPWAPATVYGIVERLRPELTAEAK